MLRSSVILSLMFVGTFLLSPGTVKAVTKTSTGTGNWSQANTWTPNGVPGSGDDVVIANTHVVDYTVPGTSTVLSVTINAGGTLRLNDNSANTLAVTGNVVNNGTVIAGGPGNRVHTLTIGGNFTNGGTFTAVVGTDVINVVFNGSSAQTSNGVTTFNDLTLNNAAGLTITANQTVGAILALTNGDITTGSNTLNLNSAATTTGTGDVVGNTKRTHTFNTGTTYAFGNPNVSITFASLTQATPNININLVKGSSPNNFTNSVRRYYTITPTNVSAFSATLRLRYLDTELNGNTEASLQLWRETGTTWNAQGATTLDSTNNWVQLAGVTGFSRWTISGPSAPTDVTMVSLQASRKDGRVLLEWQTGFEVSNVGFNIYREEKGNLVKITEEPVAGSALSFGPRVALRAGFSYTWWDKTAADDPNVKYWLEDLDISGRTTVHGPYFVSRSAGGVKTSSPVITAPSLGAVGKAASMVGSSAQVERKARLAQATTQRLGVQTLLSAAAGIKISVKHEGWYRIEQADLVAAGLPSDVEQRLLALFVDGQEIPMTVTGTGSAPVKGGSKLTSLWDGIEFYGIGPDSAYSASRVYWLMIGTDPGQRINVNPGGGGSPAPTSFSYSVERRDKTVYFSAVKNGGAEKFFGPVLFNAQAVDQSVTLQNIDAAALSLAVVDVSLQGFTDSAHNVRVLLNGVELGALQFNGITKGTAQYLVPHSSLVEGSNQIQLISPAGFSDLTLADYVRITYQHTNKADNNSLRFTGTGGQLTSIGGFTNSSVRVVDATDPNSPQELTVNITPDGGGFAGTFTVPGVGPRVLLAFAPDAKKAVDSIVANQPSSWRAPTNAADYVAVTRKEMLNSLVPLFKQRSKQGLKTVLVDVEDLYDEFSFGNKTPQAIKDFFAYAKTTWKKGPKFALLAGDATYDPKNYLGLGDFDLVPTKLVETAFNETATDDWLVDLNGDYVPDIAVGRLPVRTVQEMNDLVTKIIGYDAYEGSSRVLLVADQNQGFDFENADSQLQSVIPASFELVDIRRGQIGDSNARSQLLDALNQGPKLVNFYGHGSTRLWTDAPILNATDAAGLANTERLSLFDAMTCLNGFFHDPSIESLGESLLKSQGGAIAVWASSGMTDPAAQVLMNQQAVQLLLSGTALSIGEVTAQAKAATIDPDVRRTWVLLGDPATKLK